MSFDKGHWAWFLLSGWGVDTFLLSFFNKLVFFFSLAFFLKKKETEEFSFFTTFVFVSLFDFKRFQGGGHRF